MQQNSGQELSHSRGQLKLHSPNQPTGSLCFCGRCFKRNTINCSCTFNRKLSDNKYSHISAALLLVSETISSVEKPLPSDVPCYLFFLLKLLRSCGKLPFCSDIDNVGRNLFGKLGIVLGESPLSWLEGSDAGSDLAKGGEDSQPPRSAYVLLRGNAGNSQG